MVVYSTKLTRGAVLPADLILMLNDVLLQHLQQQLPLPEGGLLPCLYVMMALTTSFRHDMQHTQRGDGLTSMKSLDIHYASLGRKVLMTACGGTRTSAAFLAFFIFALTLALAQIYNESHSVFRLCTPICCCHFDNMHLSIQGVHVRAFTCLVGLICWHRAHICHAARVIAMY